MDKWNDVERMMQAIKDEYRDAFSHEALDDTLEILSIADYWKKQMEKKTFDLKLKLKEKDDHITLLASKKQLLDQGILDLKKIVDEKSSVHLTLTDNVKTKDETIQDLTKKIEILEKHIHDLENEIIHAEEKREAEEKEFLDRFESMNSQQKKLIETLSRRDQLMNTLDRDKRKTMRHYVQAMKQMQRRMMMIKSKEKTNQQNYELLSKNFTNQLSDLMAIISGKLQFTEIRFPMKNELKNTLETITQNIEELKWIIDEFLLLSVRPHVQLKPVNVNIYVQNVMKLMQERAQTLNITFKYFGDDGIPEVYIDQELMMDCFINILQNAFEATPAKGAVIIKSAIDIEHQNLVIKISDTGYGMTSEQRLHVFEPYFTTKKGHKGTGLTIAERIIDLHDGSVHIESEPQKGTTVSIFLKLPRSINTETVIR